MNWKNSCMHTRMVSSKSSNGIESEQKSECASFWLLFYGKSRTFSGNLRLNIRQTKEEGKTMKHAKEYWQD